MNYQLMHFISMKEYSQKKSELFLITVYRIFNNIEILYIIFYDTLLCALKQLQAERMRPLLFTLFLSNKRRSEEHTSELQSRFDLVCRLLLEKKKKYRIND